jgi:HTH-type transcriptional regulator / antitoxin HipB
MRVKTSKDIGALIRDQRTKRAWTQEQLAARVGVSRLWIVQLEKGKPTAQLGLTLRALKELGVTIDAATGTDAGVRHSRPAQVDLDQIIRSTLPAKP